MAITTLIEKVILVSIILVLSGCDNKQADEGSQIKYLNENIHIEAYMGNNLIDYLDERFAPAEYYINPYCQTEYEKIGEYHAKVFVEKDNTIYNFTIDYSDQKPPTVKQKEPIILYKGVDLKDHEHDLAYMIEEAVDYYDESGNFGVYSPDNESEYFPTDEEGVYYVPWYVSDGINNADITLEVYVVKAP